MDMRKLMEQAMQMQSHLKEELDQVEQEGNSGGGMVRARMNGKKELLSLIIDPEALAGNDREMLQDLIIAAVNQCSRNVDAALQSRLGSLAQRLNLPGLS